jgi:molybdopterin converting factor small subunit
MGTSVIHIRYFGILREQLGTDQEHLEWTGASSDELLRILRARDAAWAEALAPERIFKIALNQTLLHEPTHIPDGAQVGFLPPVTGG